MSAVDTAASGGSYDLLRRRLAAQCATLGDIAGRLDAARIEAYGSQALRLTGSDRLTTEYACAPRDMARVGDLLLLGYNTELTSGTTQPEHVFSVFRVADTGGENPAMQPLAADDPANFLADPAFREEFSKLYRFYGKARFADLRTTQQAMLAVFQVGDRLEDIRVLRWALADTESGPRVSFVDGRGERDYTWLAPHELTWQTATREDQRAGAHPVIAVLDEVLIGFRNGRLQLRVDTGTGTTRAEIDEHVAHGEQALADVRADYATDGEILIITVHLYDEAARTYVFSRRTHTGTRVDAAGATSRVLPGGGGIIFPGGLHLTSTGTRLFDVDVDRMVLEEIIVSPNGEDVAYVYHRRDTGSYLIMPYNLVRRDVAQVIACHGFGIFGDGSMVLFRGAPQDAEASKVHPVQWWTTPFADTGAVLTVRNGDAWAQRVGNAALVAGLGDVFDMIRLAGDTGASARTWETVAATARRALDTHLWFADDEALGLRAALHDALDTAGQLLDEYALVERKRVAARATLDQAGHDVRSVLSAIGAATTPDQVVSALGTLRATRGRLAEVADTEGIDRTGVEELIGLLDEGVTTLSDTAVHVLSQPDAFASLTARLDRTATAVAEAPTAAELDALAVELDGIGNDLDAVVDTVSSLEGGDATVRTGIVRAVADVTGTANRVRTALDIRRRSLGADEAAAAFDAELALVEQTLNGSVAGANTPGECDAVLSRLLVTIERLESRYGQEPDRVARIAELRQSAHETVGARRSALLDEQTRRAARMADAATRLLTTVVRRASEYTTDAEVAAFFATDALTARVRELAAELEQVEPGRAQEVRNGLRDAQEEARRKIRDKAALVAEDGSVVLGGFRLAANPQAFEIVLSPGADDRVFATVSGTDYASDVTDTLAAYGDLLPRSYPSETPDVSRSEYLAWAVLASAQERGELATLISTAAVPDRLAEMCRVEAERRHGDGYQRGVHDHDAARILAVVLPQLSSEPLLRFTGVVRALARLWLTSAAEPTVAGARAKASAARTAAARLGTAAPRQRLEAELAVTLAEFVGERTLFTPAQVTHTAAYLAEELANGTLLVATSAEELHREFAAALGADGLADLASATAVADDVFERYLVARDWLTAYIAADITRERFGFDLAEGAALVAVGDGDSRRVTGGGVLVVTGLVADHPRITNGTLTTRLDAMADTVGSLYEQMRVRWPAYQAARAAAVGEYHERIKLDEHRPKVMAGFVRNQLIDQALLPLLGANLARQLGTIDPTDVARQGLLVVISPPGYGKTTLIEWLADRLGLLLVKVNGPALGQDTTSLDPAQAPNATARAEVEKINLALRFGRNTMLYLDDIQHTNPVLLSRFIPLADATRRIEGVVDGVPTTFDLRGRRLAVVMAGNPYSTGGGRFEMPDMLVNRSDVFNLGDVSDTHHAAFARSYIENSLTACPVLAPHASKLLDDLTPVLQMAEGTKPIETAGLAHVWDGVELEHSVRAVALLRRAQRVLLAVNAAYIASAATNDDDRVAPPFLLQGSYRNMARIAARVASVMTDAELDAVVDDHYRSEAQTLTDQAEANLLAYQALTGRATDAERARWAEIIERWEARLLGADGAGRVAAAVDRLAAAVGEAAGGATADRAPTSGWSPPVHQGEQSEAPSAPPAADPATAPEQNG